MMKKLKNTEWITVNLPYGPIYSTIGEKDSFSMKNLNRSGTLIEMKNGKTYLIGHINPLRGVCDDCVEFYKNEIVKRYKVIVDFADKKE